MIKIRKIKLDAPVNVYDITVPEASNFYANDVVVHNCSEISLFCDENHSFSCVLSSMNLARRDEYRHTNAIQWATVFLDCVAQEFIEVVEKRIKPSNPEEAQAMEKVVRYTKKARSLGLGACGLHTYFQQKSIPFESFEAHMLNNEIFKEMFDESLKASQWMAKEWGEPEWCVGTGLRNTHRLAIAPTKSTASISGGVSEGIGPMLGNAFTSALAGGEFDRVNPPFLDLMKSKGKFTTKNVDSIAMNAGSVQNIDWLTDHEKKVFKTAFEIDQTAILRMAASRQKSIDQTQSLNLFFSAEEKEEYVAATLKQAFLDENIHSIYYVYSKTGVQASKGECEACM